ncbi:P-loop containing nucleoside triphosphate hydrolase protein [Massarina eburnea CBS 473.64]|uniref:P-loop containing nucleoside triphosphate hydrolase protein n=1 Tax=Massarina eburnea CBS 473.64 TaxID=1395130 RepID=A0A6A6S4W9_9PLEO|nr:P-loop containing nucleoside triphosphate hydrolase protein [Massarina eburnea CBS 473.64]
MSVSTTFAPGLGSKTTIMDLAATAIIPDMVPATIAPLVKLIYGFLLKKGRIDITATITKLAIAAGAIYSIKTIWDFAKPFFLGTLTTSITLPIEHQTAKDIQEWLAARDRSAGRGAAQRHIRYTATGMTYNKATQKFELEGDKQTNIDGGWFFFKKQPLYFAYTRMTGDQKQPAYVDANDSSSKQLCGDEITIYAFGLTNILDDLVKEVSVAQIVVKGTTSVFHVTDLEDNNAYRAGYLMEWLPRAKQLRPMSTIDLSAELKKKVLDDITQFLEPSRERFYNDRGIPYSRKILAFGPPGTGKSSFALALAGMVHGSLYQANIGEIRDEAHMRRLFSCPGKGDVLLLEDIDSANIKREKMKGDKKKKKRSWRRSPNIVPQPSTISLSGLLNAIDAIPDGVILIMTSNSPESLDKALVRPGRIDKQVLFGYVSKAVAETIFIRMFQRNEELPQTPEVAALAMAFAKKIPDLKLTPAEVQGYLIPRSDPLLAVAEADKWVKDVLDAREKGRNIVGVKGDDASLGLKKKKGKKSKKPKKDSKKAGNSNRQDKSSKEEPKNSGDVISAVDAVDASVEEDDAEFFDAVEQVKNEVKVEAKKKKDRRRTRRLAGRPPSANSSDTLLEDGSSSDLESETDSDVNSSDGESGSDCSTDDGSQICYSSDSGSEDSSNDSASEDESDDSDDE